VAIGEWTRLHGRAIYGAGPSDFDAPTDCRFTQRENRLYLHVFSWPFQHIHLEGFAGKVEYAQLLNDASEVKIREGDPHAVAQNTTSSGSEGELVLSLPIQKPDVLVPVIELFLK
jgi:alpha-L-fucosidase